jgi:hypothetical protein
MTIHEVRIENWNELQEQLFFDSWNSELGRFRSRNAFRGLPNADYRLETTLIRLGGLYANLEQHLLRNFRKYAHRDIVKRDTIWHWLSIAQHHGLPTRLMDWTYSPFVAMHFATANIDMFDVDGAIWSVNYSKAHQYLPPEMKTLLDNEGANVFTVDMLGTLIGTLSEFEHLSRSEFLVFFEPPSMNDRIINQFAFFSVLSNPKLALDNWLQERPCSSRKIIIPASLKWEIRDKLDQGNITERVLFPGLDGLGCWLKRHYSPIQQNDSVFAADHVLRDLARLVP